MREPLPRTRRERSGKQLASRAIFSPLAVSTAAEKSQVLTEIPSNDGAGEACLSVVYFEAANSSSLGKKFYNLQRLSFTIVFL